MAIQSVDFKASPRKRRAWLAWLVVAGVIVIVGLGVFPVNGPGDMPVTETRMDIAVIHLGLRKFSIDFDHLPHDALEAGAETNDPKWIRRWLLGVADGGGPDEAVRANPLWNGPYADFQEEDLSKDGALVFADAWGRPIRFELVNPIFRPENWDIWSLGPDGQGTKDMGNITGGTAEERRKRYETLERDGRKVNEDNIGNW